MPLISKTDVGEALLASHPESRSDSQVKPGARLRPAVRWLWIQFLKVSGCFWWAKRSLRRRGATVVLAFHRVLDDYSFDHTGSLPGIVLREKTFDNLAKYVSECYEAVGATEVIPGAAASKLRFVITFDDGWSDNLGHALPIARRYRIPFIVFVCPGLDGANAPFWPEQVIGDLKSSSHSLTAAQVNSMIEGLKRIREDERGQRIAEVLHSYGVNAGSARPFNGDSTLSMKEIAEMHGDGVAIGSHTNTHQILTGVSPDAVRQEVRKSKGAIENALGGECKAFAYPNGNWSPEIKHILAEEGIELAFTTEVGAWTATSDPLSIPRVNVSESNVVGWNGEFSGAMFDYSTIWRAWRGTVKR